jgi:hypothetical protein
MNREQYIEEYKKYYREQYIEEYKKYYRELCSDFEEDWVIAMLAEKRAELESKVSELSQALTHFLQVYSGQINNAGEYYKSMFDYAHTLLGNNTEQIYSGHVRCKKCNHVHWMYGNCLECNYLVDGGGCVLCGLTTAESLQKNANNVSEKLSKMLSEVTTIKPGEQNDKVQS